MDAGRRLIREPDVSDPAQYRRRVAALAAIYVAIFALSGAGLALLVVHGRLFVTLSQRSNVETLTIAFLLLFFGYLALLSARGAWGGLRIGAFRLAARLGRDPERVERWKIAALGGSRKRQAVAVNLLIERAAHSGEPFELRVADGAGCVGNIHVDGARIEHRSGHREGSSELLAYFVRQVSKVRGSDLEELEIIHWKSVDDEGWYQYLAGVESMRILGRRFGGEPLWPRLTLSQPQVDELERRMSALCRAVREEAFLPQLEYEGEHKIPIIPEPLGIVSLGRHERRVDPLSSMGLALVIVAAVVALIVWFIVRPPWVPGR
jgi:hypothetical protein